MPDPVEQTRKLIAWCRSQARPFLSKHHSEARAEQLDRDVASLAESLAGVDQELSVCFLGAAGVGKSTLINALVAGREAVVPAGGVGPLTAQALNVRYSPEARFEVSYHPLQRLWQLVFGLRQMYEAELRAQGVDAIASQSADDGSIPLDPTDIAELRDSLASDETRRQRFVDFRKTAQLLVKGNQDGEERVEYLLDRLYEAASRPPLYGTTALPEDDARISRIRATLEMAKADQEGRFDRASDGERFREELKIHASGFLAPLIQELVVYWDSPLLREGMRLVDLPGIGIAGDVYREVTRKWVRERADVVVLVVGRAGITEADAEMLRSTEFLSRLLHITDPHRSPRLMVAVVRVDDVALSQYEDDASVTEADHFGALCEKFPSMIGSQLKVELEKVWSPKEGIGEGKQEALERILHSLNVQALSAVQYRQVLAGNRRAFVTDQEQTNVPRLTRSLQALANDRRRRRLTELWDKARRLHSKVMADVKVIRAEWRREDRAVAEAETLRSEVQAFVAPLREELRVRQGQYREFLKETVPQQIETMVVRAQVHARKDIINYLGKLQDAPWNTLRAAVIRGGTFFGKRRIDLPQDFGLRFEEPIAEVWSKEILTKIRQRTRQFSEDCVGLVEQVVTWARAQGARVNSEVVEAQRDAIRADAKNLTAVGRDKVNELSEQVKNSLIKQIEPPIRKRCKAFVERNQDRGIGAKRRMLDLFDNLAEEVIDAAAGPATDILTRLYGDVRNEINQVFTNWSDPLQSATDAIVSTQESFLKRSDGQKRGRILEAVEAVLSSLPPELAELEMSDAESATDSTGVGQASSASPAFA